MIIKDTNIKKALKSKQRGFLLNPYRFTGPIDTDPQYGNVKALFHFDNSYRDNSPLDRLWIPSGATVALSSTYSFYGGYSLYMQGNGDRISSPNPSDFSFGTGDFDISLLFYLIAVGDAYRVMFKLAYPGGAFSMRFGNTGFGQRLQVGSNDTTQAGVYSLASTQSTLVNGWHLMQWRRVAGVSSVYLDGSLQTVRNNNYTGSAVTSWADTTNITGVTAAHISNDDTSAFYGYIDEVRVSGVSREAQVAAATFANASPHGPLDSYTSNLWSAISVSRLLSPWISNPLVTYDTTSATTHTAIFDTVHGLNADDLINFGGTHSQTVQSLTNQAGVSAQGFADGGLGITKYPTLVNSGNCLGEVQFDGIVDSAATGTISGAPSGFTVFLRGKIRNPTGTKIFIEHSNNFNNNHAAVIYIDAGSLCVGVHGSAGYARSDFAGVAPNDNVHCYRVDRTALTGATMAVCFVNGAKQTRSASGDSGTLPSGNFGTHPWYMGARAGTSLYADLNVHTLLIYEGALSDTDCIAISAIISALPKQQPDPHFSSVSLLLHGEGTNGSTTIIDISASAKVATLVGTPTISTTQRIFGGASLLFGGTADAITYAHAVDLNLASGDFTIEAWIYIAATGIQRCILQKDQSYGTTFPSYGLLVTATGRLAGSVGTGASAGYNQGIDSANGVITAAIWQHVAFTRAGTTLRLFANGILVQTATQTGTPTDGGKVLTIGRYPSGGGVNDMWWSGHLDDIRITKGRARYFTNFTVPMRAFPNA